MPSIRWQMPGWRWYSACHIAAGNHSLVAHESAASSDFDEEA